MGKEGCYVYCYGSSSEKTCEEKESFFDMLTQYTSHMGFFIGQGIGSVLISQNTEDFKISL